MNRILFRSSFVLFLFSAVFPIRANGDPYIELYFDRALTQTLADCPDPGWMADTLYVAIGGFQAPVEGIEYQIIFPPQIGVISFIESDKGLTMYDSHSYSFSMAFFTPQEASGPVLIQEIEVLWLCNGCSTHDGLVTLTHHLVSGSLRAVTSDLVFVDVQGLTSIVCPSYLGSDRPGAAAVSRPAAAPASEQCVLDCPAGDGGVIIPGELPEQHHSPDLDGDSVVSFSDFSLFAVGYPPNAYDSNSDFLCSGSVDLVDFVLFTRHWGHSGAVPASPSTWGGIKALYSD
jgi:hypothetical protein